MKKILLLTTGGTIASVESDRGLKPELTGEDLIEHIPEASVSRQSDSHLNFIACTCIGTL